VIVARRYVIAGRVQGVGFRFFAEDQARIHHVSGYVRNLPDGRVEALAEGEDKAVEAFERALHRGPRGARVEQVVTEAVAPDARYGFTIRS
jgi:acylphosphatase